MMRGPKESLASWKRRLARRSAAMRRRPGRSWRVLVQNSKAVHVSSSKGLRKMLRRVPKCRADLTVVLDGPPWEGTVFDELVIDDWLHLEQMDDRYWWLRVGDYVLWITIPRKRAVEVTVRKETELPISPAEVLAAAAEVFPGPAHRATTARSGKKVSRALRRVSSSRIRASRRA